MPLLTKSRLSVSVLVWMVSRACVMVVQGCDSHWRGRHRHYVSAAVLSAQGVFILQPQDHGHMGWTRLLAVQAKAQV